MYKIRLSRTAESAYAWLYKHDRRIFERIKGAMESLASDPFQGKALKWELKGKFSYRVGTYRIIYEVKKDRVTIYVLDIGHRREIYRHSSR